jgi:hypothetical protein
MDISPRRPTLRRRRQAVWNVKDGRLYWGQEPVAIRRVVVEMVAGRTSGPLASERVRTMIRMERALSLRDLSAGLTGPPAPP